MNIVSLFQISYIPRRKRKYFFFFGNHDDKTTQMPM